MKVSLLAGVLATANIWAYQAAASSLLNPARELSGRRAKSLSSTTAASGALPTVDLGYAIHQATINETGKYYNFSNIRYASPPLGKLRFAGPVPPIGRNTTINDGQHAVICPQANPSWELLEAQFITGTNLSTIGAELAAQQSSIPPIPKPGPTENEDCLFLDVVTPVAAYKEAKSKSEKDCTKAPVLVWIYGGGYVGGNKATNPGGLLAQSRIDGSDGFVFVSLNYRLGMFGFLSGPSFQIDGTANAGLYDQRLALQWVQKYIHLFGGDPDRVTVMGESAGGGSILHQVTAFGGMKGKAPFQQAIAQSPAWQNVPGYAQQENTYGSVLEYASLVANKSITNLADLRGLSTSQLQAVNAIAVGKADWSMFSFGPTVDGKFVPALPSVLLLHGQFDNSVKVMVGHNLNESFLFTPPLLTSDTAITSYFRSAMPSITNATISYLSEVLYPPIFNGSYGYVNDFTRAALIIAESSFTCNTRYLDLAFKNRTYSYFFTVPPGFHGEDIAYTFFDGDTTTSDEGPPVNATVATTFQQYLAGFVMDGNPNSGGRARPVFPLYGSNSTILNIDIQDNGTTMKDTVANARCDWWQRGLYA